MTVGELIVYIILMILGCGFGCFSTIIVIVAFKDEYYCLSFSFLFLDAVLVYALIVLNITTFGIQFPPQELINWWNSEL